LVLLRFPVPQSELYNPSKPMAKAGLYAYSSPNYA
jgi:hypothetical protein